MKEMTTGQKMRWAAGAVYLALAVYQMVLTRGAMQNGTLANLYLTWLYAILLVPAAGAMGAWLLGGRRHLSGKLRRMAVAVTGLCVVFELLTYGDQTSIIGYTMYELNPVMATNPMSQFLFMVVRLALMVVAAFLVTNSRTEDTPEAVPDWVEALEKKKIAEKKAELAARQAAEATDEAAAEAGTAPADEVDAPGVVVAKPADDGSDALPPADAPDSGDEK